MAMPMHLMKGNDDLQEQILLERLSKSRDEVAAPEDRSEETTAALFCLFFFSRDSALGRDVADYVIDSHEALDRIFGPRLHGFAIPLPESDEEASSSAAAYEFARAYGVHPDEFPCALVATSLESKRSLMIPFERFLPPAESRDQDDLAAVFRAIAGAAERCADTPERRRIGSFQRSLRKARRNVYGNRVPKGDKVFQRVASDSEAVARILEGGKSVAQVLGPAVAIVIGGLG